MAFKRHSLFDIWRICVGIRSEMETMLLLKHVAVVVVVVSVSVKY